MDSTTPPLLRLNRDTHAALGRHAVGPVGWQAYLEATLDDNIVIQRTDVNSSMLSKAELIDRLASIEDMSSRLVDDTVRVWGDKSLGVVVSEVEMPEEDGRAERVLHTKVFQRAGDEWKCVLWQMALVPSPPPVPESLRMAYDQLCQSHNGIREFRGKLLGFLPIASAGGIFLLMGMASRAGESPHALTMGLLGPIGVFGFAVTLGLYAYELRGIQQCNALIRAGDELERRLGVEGQFRLRPGHINGQIGTTLASFIVFSAVLAAWTAVALWPTDAAKMPYTLALAAAVFVVSWLMSANLKLKPKLAELREPNRE